ncbi:MAG: hypothetical protein OSJ22_00255 [Rikenellaceae bacterium]|nr:hypothetical protein [Rikenellaceae bacterium]
MNEKEKKESRLNIRIMIVLIAVLLTGIVLRRDFIASELKATFRNMFPTAADTVNTVVKR